MSYDWVNRDRADIWAGSGCTEGADIWARSGCAGGLIYGLGVSVQREADI